MILMAIVYAVSIACTIVLNNLIYVNAGFMYYDSRTDLHRNVTFLKSILLGLVNNRILYIIFLFTLSVHAQEVDSIVSDEVIEKNIKDKTS